MSEPVPINQTLKIADLPRSRSEKFITAYCNHTESTPSFYEFELLFSHIHKNQDGIATVEQQAQIIMTWEHTLKVRDLLNRVVEAYQDQRGSIRLMTEADGSDHDAEEGSAPEKG
jgi:hypothetical protein